MSDERHVAVPWFQLMIREREISYEIETPMPYDANGSKMLRDTIRLNEGESVEAGIARLLTTVVPHLATNAALALALERHQLRVVIEKEALDEKIAKLKAFISGFKFSTLDVAEARRLQAQYHSMCQYAAILAARIEAFR